MKKIVAGSLIAVVMGSSASAALIASESFSTRNGTKDYTDKDNLGGTLNANVLIGTTGFSSGKPWKASTGTLMPSISSLTHVSVQGSAASGLLHVVPPKMADGVAISRKSFRELASAPSGSVFYMSVLVSMGGALKNLDPNESAAIGLASASMREGWNIVSGIHLGLTKDSAGDVYPAAFAGGNTYKLGKALTAAQATETQMLVLKLDIDTSGKKDTLTAWIAQQGDSVLTQVLSTDEVDIGTISDLKVLVVQVLGGMDANFASGIRIDEFRFGTDLQDVSSAGTLQ